MIWLAWIEDHDTAFDPEVHCREDLTILSLRISEEAGVVPIFEVEMPNPGVAGLLTQPERYAILSEKTSADSEPVELARGIVTSVPSELASTTVRLEFRCQPPDCDEVWKSAADALRHGEIEDYDPDADADDREDAESYDPLYYGNDANEDPNSALEGRPEDWVWDRRALTLSRTDILTGSRVVDIGGSALEGSVSMQLLDPPPKTMRMRIDAQWTQRAKGVQTWPIASGSGISDPVITSLTWENFMSSFPQPGAAIGTDTGWTLAEASAKYLDEDSPDLPSDINVTAGKAGKDYPNPEIPAYPPGTKTVLTWRVIQIHMRAAYDYQQARQETLILSMPVGVQDVLRDDKTESIEVVTLNNLTVDVFTPEWLYEDPDTLEVKHYAVGDRVQSGGKTWECVVEHDAEPTFTWYDPDSPEGSPLRWWEVVLRQSAINDVRTPKFFDTTRGTRAVRHGLRRLARVAKLRSRCLEVTFECAWPLARELTLDDSVRLEYRLLPGGEVTGKVVAIELQATENGSRYAQVKLGVCHGLGDPTPDPDEDESQTADIVYGQTAQAVNVPVNAYALATQEPSIQIYDEYPEQDIALFAELSTKSPEQILSENPTMLLLGFPPLREEDLLPRRINVLCEPLSIPMGINLQPSP